MPAVVLVVVDSLVKVLAGFCVGYVTRGIADKKVCVLFSVKFCRYSLHCNSIYLAEFNKSVDSQTWCWVEVAGAGW